MTDKSSNAWAANYRSWLDYVADVVRTYESGKDIPIGPSPEPLALPADSAPPAKGFKVVICAPHPDDETLSGALPLRWRLEAGAQVTDCAITLGSDHGQRERRRRELASACRVLGFEMAILPTAQGATGLDDVNPASHRQHPKAWAEKVNTLAEFFDQAQPDVVQAPHAEDFNTTHLGTRELVVEALGMHLEHRGGGASLPLIESESWHQLAAPNLMLALTPEVVALQLMAAAEHGGEMVRNPYHLRHCPRLMHNVQRGSEVVLGQGGPALPYVFAELYRVTFMRGREFLEPRPGGCIVAPREHFGLEELMTQFGPQGN
jgi:LmbE family N-acetylglucosaminyl deacetylase